VSTVPFRRLLVLEGLVIGSQAIAGSFSGVFLLRSGLIVQDAGLFYLITFASAVAACFAFSLAAVRRYRMSIAAFTVVSAGFYASLLLLPIPWVVFIPPILWGASIPLFWLPFNVVLVSMTRRENRGVILGLSFLVIPLVTVVAPLVGGSFIEGVGYWAAFGAAVALLIALAGVALTTEGLPEMAPRLRLSFRRVGAGTSAAFLFEGVYEGATFLAIPLVAFGFSRSEFSVGQVLALFALLGAISSVILGRRSDRRGGRRAYLRAGALLTAPLVLAAGFAPDLLGFTLALGLANLPLYVVIIFLFAIAMDLREKAMGDSVLVREVMLNLGRSGGVVLVLLLLPWVGLAPAMGLAGLFLLPIAVIPLR
jgi:predicted MFS family arabinose efflux permease